MNCKRLVAMVLCVAVLLGLSSIPALADELDGVIAEEDEVETVAAAAYGTLIETEEEEAERLESIADALVIYAGQEEATAESENAGLTPEGNLTLVDDLEQYNAVTGEGQEILTVSTRNGNIFFIIIDKDDEDHVNNVYFLNLVDEWDLTAIIEAEDLPDGYELSIGADSSATTAESNCVCAAACSEDAVNEECEACLEDETCCEGYTYAAESVVVTEDEKETESAEMEEALVTTASNSKSLKSLILPVMILVAFGVFALKKKFPDFGNRKEKEVAVEEDLEELGEEDDEYKLSLEAEDGYPDEENYE